MSVSVYSVVMAMLWFSLAVLAGQAALWNAGRYGLVFVGAIFFLALVRVVVPLDLANAILLQSEVIYPAVQDWLRLPLAGKLTRGGCLLLIWAAGSIVCLSMLAWKLFRQRAFRRNANVLDAAPELYKLLDQVCDELGSPRQGKLALSPSTSTAYQAGFFRPYIVLPASDFSERDIRNMLRHELCHFLGGDLWIKVGSQAVAGLMWWNPVMYLFKRDVELLLEMRCDRRVCRHFSEEEQIAYLDTLLLLTKERPVLTSTVSMGCLSQRADADLFRRFKFILNGSSHPVSRFKRIATCVVCAALFLLSYCVLLQPARFPPDDELADEVYYDLEDSYLVQTADGRYDFYCNGEYTSSLERDILDTEPFNQLPILSERISKP